MNGIDEYHRVVEGALYIWKSWWIVLWNLWKSESECLVLGRVRERKRV